MAAKRSRSSEGTEESVPSSRTGRSRHSNSKRKLLETLGVYGFGDVEPVILAALVTEDPLLLIGASGTGKTFLLNSISEALGLEHRHYNASLIAFDDLIGFPYPDDEKSSVRYLETPATVWGAESVLVDEISRCKPEHQNRLFSLIHERRIQGLPLSHLRYRWAAMNPASQDQSGGSGSFNEGYTGSDPLDPALADRFGLMVQVSDWRDLTEQEQRLVADPAGEGLLSDDGGTMKALVEGWRAEFLHWLKECPSEMVEYSRAAANAFADAGVRISPRRTRLIARSLLAASIVGSSGSVTNRRVGKSVQSTEGGKGGPAPTLAEKLTKRVLECSLPQQAYGEAPAKSVVGVVHRIAWDAAKITGRDRWLNDFHMLPTLAAKARKLLTDCPDPDVGAAAVCELLTKEERDRAAAFALAFYPAAAAGKLPIAMEAVSDLGRFAAPLLTVNGEISWTDSFFRRQEKAPQLIKISPVLSKLEGGRLERARQLFYWCLVEKIDVNDPEDLEEDLNGCVDAVRKAIGGGKEECDEQ